MIKLAILISGNGTTMEAIIKACQSKKLKKINPVVVIASRPDAGGIEKASYLGIKNIFIIQPNQHSEDDFGRQLLKILKNFQIDLVSQNGWLPKTPDNVIDQYQNRIINQHPGPLDTGRCDFGGKRMYGARVSCACVAYTWLKGSKFFTEATTHFVTSEYDQGDLIKTTSLKILPHPKKPTINKFISSKTWQEKLIKKTKDLQKKLFSLEYTNTIAAIQLFADNKIKGFRRDKPLIPKEEIEIVNQAKKLAVKLFPYG